MGARAQEAVSFRSQLKDVDLLRLLGILAAGADDDTGVIDPAPGRDTLAAILKCSERTVTNRISKLVESGELEILRIGSGPGRPSAYRLLLSIPEVTCFNDEREKKGEKSSQLESRVTAIETTLEQLKGEIDAKFFSLLQAIEELKGEITSLKGDEGGKGESEREKGGSLKGESLPEVERIRSFTILTSPYGEVDPHTERVRAGEPAPDLRVETDREQDFWDKALRLVKDWQGLTGGYRSLDSSKSQDKSDFYAPALRIISEFDGDYAAAWIAVKAEYERMVGDNLNVRRLSAVSSGVLAELARARLPRSDPAVQPASRSGKAGNQGTAVESFEVFLNMMQGVET